MQFKVGDKVKIHSKMDYAISVNEEWNLKVHAIRKCGSKGDYCITLAGNQKKGKETFNSYTRCITEIDFDKPKTLKELMKNAL